MRKEKGRVWTIRFFQLLLPLIIGLAPCAYAREEWDTRAFLVHMASGAEAVPDVDHILPHVRRIDKLFHTESLAVHAVDAFFNGPSLVLTWTVHNKTDEPMTLSNAFLVNGEPVSDFSLNCYGASLAPGETIPCGISVQMPVQTCPAEEPPASVRYEIGAYGPQGDHIDSLTVDLSFKREDTVFPYSLAMDGPLVSRAGYSLYLREASLTPNALILRLEATVEGKQAALAFENLAEGRPWRCTVTDETGNERFAMHGMAQWKRSDTQGASAYVFEYIRYDLLRLPKSLTLHYEPVLPENTGMDTVERTFTIQF